MLAALPDLEPPAGFIDSALDHRPLHAGRILTGLLALSLWRVVAFVASGAVGESQITPEVDNLASQHSATVQAGVLGSAQSSRTELDYRIDTSVDMPDGFRRKSNLAVEDLRLAVYERGDESVSVFVQEGTVQWDALETDGLSEIDGLTVWVDPDKMVTVVEASNNVVTIVGLPADQMAGGAEVRPPGRAVALASGSKQH